MLFGDASTGAPTAADWGAAAGTINYDIVTRVGVRVPRRYLPADGAVRVGHGAGEAREVAGPERLGAGCPRGLVRGERDLAEQRRRDLEGAPGTRGAGRSLLELEKKDWWPILRRS